MLFRSDPLFAKMAGIWYDEYEKLYGKSSFFGGDLFHEGGVTQGVDVSAVAQGVQREMMNYNPQAIWILQAWQDNPKRQLLKELNPNNTLIIDLAGEYYKTWKREGGFGDFPWLWSHISNYGGNIGLHGRLDDIASALYEVNQSQSPSKITLQGTGATPEGIELNPVTFELANELRWHADTLVVLSYWLKSYSYGRYGLKSTNLERAWDVFYTTAYATRPNDRRPSESVFCALPSLRKEQITASTWGQCDISYLNSDYAEGVALFLSEADVLANIETYQHDAVDLVRQYISNLGRDAYYQFVQAYEIGRAHV